MILALKKYPDSDREALARIPRLALRRECFLHLMDYRERGAVILSAMAEEVEKAIAFDRFGIGGIRLAGTIWNRGKDYEMSNEAACFFVFILSLTHPALAPFLACEGRTSKAMRKAGWIP